LVPGDVRLAALLVPLSLATDLGMGHSREEAMRSCLLATGLARVAGLGEQDVATVYWTTLLRHIGCTASAHEEAAHGGGDELATRPLASRTDFRSPREALALLAATLLAAPVSRRPKVLATSLGSWGDLALRAICEVGSTMAERLGLGPGVRAGLYDMFERWDGKGVPRGIAGEAISLGARFAQVATSAVAFHDLGGSELAAEVVRRRSGRMLDPTVAAAYLRHGPAILRQLGEADPLVAAVAAEPDPVRCIPERELDDCARAFADMVDLKAPFLHGHSSRVAELAAGAARSIGMPEEDVAAVRRAAWFHDLGRVAVPDGVWERPGRLSEGEWEQVRLHAYHTERILARAEPLAPLARLAGMHHERLDGSGYHRQASGAGIPLAARVLAAADAYDAMTHGRPHRAALPHRAAATELGTGVRLGALDGDAVAAVLEATGQRVDRAGRHWPSGLSEREVEVLRLLAEGLSNRGIAQRLYISPRTAETHVQHIYGKIGFRTRAGAAMFAMRHGLID
jgi:HD-GYP domain-containing protein (c-di-GMP phosphodiesterase class II)